MRILRVNMSEARVAFEPLLEDWTLIGGRGLLDKILNREVPPDCDPTGRKNKLIFAGGPLAGTNAPQLGRISVGGKSPLTLGIKESNAGGPAAQKLDRLGIRAVVVEGITTSHKFFLLHITKDGAELISADEYVGLKNYTFYERIKERYGGKITLISIGIGGERMYKSASIALTDMLGDPSRNAGRGGLGAVMGSKGLKAIIIDDSGAPSVEIADKSSFRETVKSWIETLQKDVVCGLFSKFGTPFTIASNSYQGTMPAENYSSGRPGKFRDVTGEVIKRKVRARGGKMHGCMPGCVIKCSIIYNDAEYKRLASAYEYEAVAMLGTNLGISDPDAIGRAKFICDDLGIDFMEVGSSLGVAASGGKMKMGDASSALELLQEIEEDTDFGRILANGVVSTARSLNIKRVPAFKGQSLPGHDPRAVKGMGVTYATSPQGADHTAGLTYKQPLAKKGQIENSLRVQIRAAACDTLGYCLNSVPGGRASIYGFLAALLSARYGGEVTANDVLEIGKQTIREELAFNRGTEFGRRSDPLPEFLRTEPLYPTNQVFDVEESELATIWNRMEAYTEQEKVWEVRFPQLPSFLVGAGVVQSIGERAKRLGMCKAIIVADPVMEKLGRTAELQKILEKSGVASAVFAKVEPDPPVESIEGAAEFFKRERGDGLIALGGGSSMDTAKAIAVRATQPGLLTEYENMVGGKAKIIPPLPPIVCIPTTSGTGSETNQYAVITDRERNVKFTLMSDHLVPRLAVIDPLVCQTMPPQVTAETGLDALSHCLEGYVGMSDAYHPYYEALAFYGVKLIGRSLRRAFRDGKDTNARMDMSLAAAFGGIAFTKGLGLGHAISHVLGAFHHIPHGRGCALGLLCFVRGNIDACEEQFRDLSWALDRSEDLEASLVKLYGDLNIPLRLRELGILEEELDMIAFETSLNVVNLAANPAYVSEQRILELLKEFY